MKDFNPRLIQWYLALQSYQFTIQYRRGCDQSNADLFSRQTVWNTLDQQAGWGGKCEDPEWPVPSGHVERYPERYPTPLHSMTGCWMPRRKGRDASNDSTATSVAFYWGCHWNWPIPGSLWAAVGLWTEDHEGPGSRPGGHVSGWGITGYLIG